jgi:pimeloyl-ACP methyl ester carboxylesterase
VSFPENHYLTAVDGVRLHIRIKGTPGIRPPLLYLHGGPGGGLNLAAFETCAGPYLEPHFPVAYLHQRGVLRSRGSEKIDQSLPLHIQDIHTAVSFLRRKFQRPRIYLVGHSWGGFTGFAYLVRYTWTVAGFVAICPVVSFPHVQQVLYALVSKMVGLSGDPTARRELDSIGEPPYPDIDDFIRLQGLAVELRGDPYRHISVRDLSGYTGYSMDADHCLAIQAQIAASLWPELYTLDLTASLKKLAIPLLMIACGRDGAVPAASVESAFSAYGTSNPGVVKQWLLLEGGNHLPFTEPANRQRCMEGALNFLMGCAKSKKGTQPESRFPFEK